ncbi:MAG: sulfite exporter TauE/SafE family protein [Candidatus Margulisiibacteriota bacterium]
MPEVVSLIFIGLLAGTLSGLLGIGGATILIPALLLIYKMTQHMAQGTSIAALLLPVGLLAAIKYHQAGNVNIKFAVILAVGFLVGGYIGAVIAQPIPDDILRKLFGAYLLIIAVQMIFFS